MSERCKEVAITGARCVYEDGHKPPCMFSIFDALEPAASLSAKEPSGYDVPEPDGSLVPCVRCGGGLDPGEAKTFTICETCWPIVHAPHPAPRVLAWAVVDAKGRVFGTPQEQKSRAEESAANITAWRKGLVVDAKEERMYCVLPLRVVPLGDISPYLTPSDSPERKTP